MKPSTIGASFRKPVGKAREKQMKHDAYERRKRTLKLRHMTAKVTHEYKVETVSDVKRLMDKLMLAGYNRDTVKGKTVVPVYYALWSDGQVTRGEIPLEQDMAEVMSDDFRSITFKADTVIEPYAVTHKTKPIRDENFDDHTGLCPSCGSQLVEKWSGVACSVCSYVFCL